MNKDLEVFGVEEKELKKEIEKVFYWLHRHPELSYEEHKTTDFLKEQLKAKEIKILDLPLKTGFVAEIGTGKQPIIAIRCDIDALPIKEETCLEYCSELNGKMHACGHDFHASTILGAAYLLKNCEKELKGTVRIVFQPAEEAPGGALDVLETKVLDDVQAMHGLHCSPLFDVGTIGIKKGAVTAAVDKFKITFKGKGTHAAHPNDGIDPIVAVSSFVSTVQTIVSRNMDPFSVALVSITHIEGGNTWNVIPETAFLEGTARTLTVSDRRKVKERIFEIAENVALANKTRAEVEWIAGPPPTDNDEKWCLFAKDIAKEVGLKVETTPSSLGGEDFAYYQEKIKGAFVQIGTGKSYPLHNPHFKVDPKALFPAATFFAKLVKKGLERL